MNEVVERVARAICIGDPDQSMGKHIMRKLPDGAMSMTVSETEFQSMWEFYVPQAWRALAAMGFMITDRDGTSQKDRS